MGCDYYNVKDTRIHFSDGDETYGCLCTFPHNYGHEKLDAETVRSLAALGAAVVLIKQGEFKGDYLFLPGNVPEWILQEIDRVLQYEPPAEE